jgi:hypothetical protein
VSGYILFIFVSDLVFWFRFRAGGGCSGLGLRVQVLIVSGWVGVLF